MSSPSLLPPPGYLNDCYNASTGLSVSSDVKSDGVKFEPLCKKRKDCNNLECSRDIGEIEAILPSLQSPDYYVEPCLRELAQRELENPGSCKQVLDFTIGRLGYGYVRFLGETDVRWLSLDQIVKFNRHEIVVYEDENTKPPVGQGLNKTAEVTLILKHRFVGLEDETLDTFAKNLRDTTERQGAEFLSFDPMKGQWKFMVRHFSRFGLNDVEDDDIMMDDVDGVHDPVVLDGGDGYDMDNDTLMDPNGPELAHSLPAHLGLDPTKMNEMRMLMFPGEEDDTEDSEEIHFRQKEASSKQLIRSPLQNSVQGMIHRSSPPVDRKTPLALLEYHPSGSDANSPGTILMAQQNKGMPLKKLKAEGFELDLKYETPVTGNHSRNIVDAALFMGRSFRVGWGPNGVLVHTGNLVGSSSSRWVLSSVINLEKVAIDNVVRDENKKVRKELVEHAFDMPLDLHRSLDHETEEVKVGTYKLKLQKVVCSRLKLSDICRSYTDIIERQLEITGLSPSACLVLTHQIMVWELIRVLFSERENGGLSKSDYGDNEEEMMQDMTEISAEYDQEALPFRRRAWFSYWLQESVCHRVQDEISSLNETNHLKQIFLLLTGRQLDAAVELAASRGDVRLACLLSQAGGSMLNRSDVAQQLDLWRMNGLDFSFIEKDRSKLYELLAGNIHGSLHDVKIDWKRFLGLLMWYHMPPDTSLPNIFHAYRQLLDEGRAPHPVPIYIDEGPSEDAANWSIEKRCDLSYYLMLLHASNNNQLSFLKTMFSAFSSTNDPLDYHMIWHQRSVLESVGTFHSKDLHVLDMALVSQLLCQGQCHWAIYVVLHIPHRDDFPYLHAKIIREILFQYCETWNSQDSQREFIEDLGVPSEWMHEAMATYYNYYGDLSKALEHFIGSANWQKAHSIFVTSIAHTLFLSAQHEEIWRLATLMEDYKSEIENWDLGAGVYISFYSIRSSLQEDRDTMSELYTLENKNSACSDFIGCLNESLAVWGGRLPLDARVTYSKMAEEICSFLLSDIGEAPTPDIQLSCFDNVFAAPIPENLRSSYLQDEVSLFTTYLSEVTT